MPWEHEDGFWSVRRYKPDPEAGPLAKILAFLLLFFLLSVGAKSCGCLEDPPRNPPARSNR